MASTNIEAETGLRAEDPLIASDKNLPKGFNFLSIPPIIERIFSLHKYLSTKTRVRLYKASVWSLTFICYTAFHLSRKSISVVKSALTNNCNQSEANAFSFNATCNQGWAPFNSNQGVTLLGVLDYSFLLTYAVAMFFSGAICDRTNLRCFLAVGTLASGGFMILLGLAYFLQVHTIVYFILVQIGNGVFQSVGHTGVFSANNHWFGKSGRGLILGIWNIHTPLGNILGSVIPGLWVGGDWGWSFLVPAFIMLIVAVLIFLFLVSDPSDVGLPQPSHHLTPTSDNSLAPSKAISFWRAFLIPGVIEYSACLFFTKLVSYTFLFWLPYIIKHSVQVNGVFLSAEKSAFLSVAFDMGGIFGGIVAGLFSDLLRSRSILCGTMLYLSIPSLFLYFWYGATGIAINTALQFIFGFLVNGPYSLITTAISADLGTHETLKNSVNAKGTVVAIVDGVGSLGAALGPLLTGLLLNNCGYDSVIYLLMCSCSLAGLVLTRLMLMDIHKLYFVLKDKSQSIDYYSGFANKQPETEASPFNKETAIS